MLPITLYIVEDELLISASLKSQLDGNGYLILGEATRGEICLTDLEKLKNKGCEPDIVLMDIHIRGPLDGIETAKRITEQYDCGIIFITGQSSKEVYNRSFSLKPFGYLLKPIDLEQTKMTIEIAAYQRKLEIENKKYQEKLVSLLEERTKEKDEVLGMYQTLLENSLMGLTIMQNERFVFVNQQAQKIFGYTREEFLAFNLDQIVELVHPDDRTKVISLSEDRLKGDELPQGTRIRVKRKDGTYTQVISHVKLISYRDMPALHQAFIEF
jgi:hypothetical protein